MLEGYMFLHITKTCLYNFDPLKPHFNIVKLGFTGVYIIFIAPACSRVRYRRPIFRPSVRLSTFMSTFDIYVKVSILINYKTKQPSNLA